MKKLIIPLICIVIILLVAIAGLSYLRIITNPPSGSPQGQYELEVIQGETLPAISQKLYDANVISSVYSLRLASIQNTVRPLQIGVYVLEVPASADEIIDQINEQTQRKEEFNRNAGQVPTRQVTIREGLTLDEVATVLSDAEVVSKTEFLTLVNSPEVFRPQYPFLPDPLDCTYGDMSSCIKYYLEGYLYPDTYTFAINGSTQDVIEQMLTNFNTKVYSNLQGELDNQELFDALVLASVIERETGRTRGVTEATAQELRQERRLMADVFYNRIDIGMKWQTDPTVTYGLDGLKVCQSTFTLDGCVFLDDPRVLTQYNTYYITGAPIGPTTSPQWTVIEATLDPEPNEYLYFVSDVTGKKYFAQTEAEHYENIEYVTDLNEKLAQ